MSLFDFPANLDAMVWRYCSLTKLVSLFERGALFFPAADRLDDPFEGSYPNPDRAASRLRRIFERLGYPGLDSPAFAKDLENIARTVRRAASVSCWHLGQFESLAMWNHYGRDAIAIQSTFRRLCTALGAPLDEETPYVDGTVRVGLVRYIDFERQSLEGDERVAPFFHKRMSFAHEHEVRALLVQVQNVFEGGAYQPVDLNLLVEAVHVAPGAPAWHRSAVEAVVRRFGFGWPVNRSSVDGEPVF